MYFFATHVHSYLTNIYFVCNTLKIRMNVCVYVNTYMYMYMPTSKSVHMDLPHFFQ